MMKPIIIVLFSMQVSVGAAQYNETILSGRPGQAITALTPGKGVFQIETGFDYGIANARTQYLGKYRDVYANQSLSNSTLFRFGLAEKFELLSALAYRSDKFILAGSDSAYSYGGLSLATFGWRYNIWQGSGRQPDVGMMFSLKLNRIDSDYRTESAAPQFIVTVITPLTFAQMTLNLGVDWDGATGDAAGLYAVNFSRSLSAKTGLFIEAYGSFDDSSFNIRYDAGGSWLLSDNLQLDIFGGFGARPELTDHFGSIGLSWRIDKRTNSKDESL